MNERKRETKKHERNCIKCGNVKYDNEISSTVIILITLADRLCSTLFRTGHIFFYFVCVSNSNATHSHRNGKAAKNGNVLLCLVSRVADRPDCSTFHLQDLDAICLFCAGINRTKCIHHISLDRGDIRKVDWIITRFAERTSHHFSTFSHSSPILFFAGSVSAEPAQYHKLLLIIIFSVCLFNDNNTFRSMRQLKCFCQ